MNEHRQQLGDALAGRFRTGGASPWQVLGDAGVLGLRVPEELGGLGLAVQEAEPVFRVLGEQCIPSPYLETAVVAVGLLLAGRSPEADHVLRAIASGRARVGLAGLERRLGADVRAARVGEAWRLTGEARMVVDDGDASHLLVVVAEGARTALFLLAREAEGLSAVSYPTIDGRFASDIRFHETPATMVLAEASLAITAACDEAAACLAVEAAALAARLVQDTCAYAKAREQFGQPIARFQVVQHRLVDMHIQARRMEAIARRAMGALAGDPRERGSLASAAKATADDAGRFVGQQAVQLHGGMGMTEELPVGRFFKRLTAIAMEFGGADEHRRRYVALAA